MAPDDISILTNSHLLDDNFIQKILEFEERGKIFTIRISLDGLESYEKVRNKKPETVLQNIKKLIENDLIVVINTTILPFVTKDEMLRMYDKLVELKVDQWNIDIPFDQGAAHENNISTGQKEYADIIVALAKRYIKNRPDMLFDSVSLFTSALLEDDFKLKKSDLSANPCSYQFKTITIDAEGYIKACPSLDLKICNISELENIEDFRQKPAWKEFEKISIRNIKKCPDCKYKEICGGGCRANVPTNNLLETDKLSCYLMQRFEKDILPLLPEKTANYYRDSFEKNSR